MELVEIAISTTKMALPRATTYGRNAKNSTINLSDLSTVLMILFENLSTVSGNVKRSTMLNSKLFTKLLPTLATDTVIAQARQVPPARTPQVDMASLQGHTPATENPTTIMGTNKLVIVALKRWTQMLLNLNNNDKSMVHHHTKQSSTCTNLENAKMKLTIMIGVVILLMTTTSNVNKIKNRYGTQVMMMRMHAKLDAITDMHNTTTDTVKL